MKPEVSFENGSAVSRYTVERLWTRKYADGRNVLLQYKLNTVEKGKRERERERLHNMPTNVLKVS